jgi:hypothetical protein
MICGDRDDLHHGQDSDGANAVTVAYRLQCLRFCATVDSRGGHADGGAEQVGGRRCRTRRGVPICRRCRPGGRVLATIEALSDEEEER